MTTQQINWIDQKSKFLTEKHYNQAIQERLESINRQAEKDNISRSTYSKCRNCQENKIVYIINRFCNDCNNGIFSCY